jgi:hypothetical protein
VRGGNLRAEGSHVDDVRRPHRRIRVVLPACDIARIGTCIPDKICRCLIPGDQTGLGAKFGRHVAQRHTLRHGQSGNRVTDIFDDLIIAPIHAEARAQGLSVYYGDASRIEVLEALGAGRARAAVIILDNAAAAERVVNLLHRRFPKLNIFVRARDNAHKRRLAEAGASGIVHETYELSLHLGESVLRGYGTPDDQIQEIIRDHRADDYALLSDVILPVTEEKGAEKKTVKK